MRASRLPFPKFFRGTAMSPEQGAFRALADPTRREILKHLSRSDMTIAEVADLFDVTRGAIKKHLVILEQGQLISVEAKGRERLNRLRPHGLKAATDWLSYFDRFWDDKLAALGQVIDAANSTKKDNDNE